MTLEEAYERMLLIRRFEEEVERLFLRGEVHGTTHLCIGQEAVAVGVAAALGPDDLVAATYRGHGHALARGVEPSGLAAELMGRATGTCGGRAGSMNIMDLDHGLIGCFGIVGGTMAAATGAAFALRDSGRVAVSLFGEGTANQAYFAECLNFAAVFALPVVFVCEHNLYGEYTPWERVTAGCDIPARAAAFGIPAETADGNDPLAVFDAASEAVRHARDGDGPSFLECRTYRFAGHSRTDPGKYRPPGELEEWRERDPIKLVATAISSHTEGAERVLSEIAAAVEERIAEVFDSALAAPFPAPSAARIPEYCDA
ncbi:MAG TPA: thiamine pyrophosphate-dependent dehydrogenase E1 component subunit alpha [Thermoleophilaceae bacterium]|jgi:TPP-dependent pyruvate/acetoin dehydrogenase alpha subunit